MIIDEIATTRMIYNKELDEMLDGSLAAMCRLDENLIMMEEIDNGSSQKT